MFIISCIYISNRSQQLWEKKDLVSPSYSLQWHLYQFCQSSVISKGYLQVRECLTPGKFAVLLIALFSVINLTLPTLMVKLQHVSPVSC